MSGICFIKLLLAHAYCSELLAVLCLSLVLRFNWPRFAVSVIRCIVPLKLVNVTKMLRTLHRKPKDPSHREPLPSDLWLRFEVGGLLELRPVQTGNVW